MPTSPLSQESVTRGTLDAKEAKKSLRQKLKEHLKTISEDELTHQSNVAQDLILNLEEYKNSKRLSIYLSMPTAEARTNLLVHDALNTGKTVFVPYIHPLPKPGSEMGKVKVMDMLRLSSTAEYEGLERDALGIPHLRTDGIVERENAMGGAGPSMEVDGRSEPVGQAAEDGEDPGGLDLVVVPGVAFDDGCGRLGHGAGFYDSYLTRFCKDGKRKRPHLVGLCLAEQVLQKGEIQMLEHDWRVDDVAVGDGRLLRKGGNS